MAHRVHRCEFDPEWRLCQKGHRRSTSFSPCALVKRSGPVLFRDFGAPTSLYFDGQRSLNNRRTPPKKAASVASAFAEPHALYAAIAHGITRIPAIADTATR